MLSILGPRSRYCDGLSRRSFLSIGGLAMGGLGLRQVLAAEAAAKVDAAEEQRARAPHLHPMPRSRETNASLFLLGFSVPH